MKSLFFMIVTSKQNLQELCRTRDQQTDRQTGAADTAEQCMNVFLTNKNTAPVKFTARTNFRPPAPVGGINTRQWSRLGGPGIDI